MSETVIAKAFGNKPLRLTVSSIGDHVVYLTSEITERLGLYPIGFPVEDVYCYTPQDWDLVREAGCWDRLTPWSGNEQKGE